MNKKLKIKLIEITLLLAIIAVYGWFFWHYFSMLPDSNDPLEYIEPSRWKTLIGYYPWVDRLMIANGIRFFSLFIPRLEIAGAVYFGVINFLILIITLTWAYLKKGFVTAFITGLLLITSYPLIRYANYGYPDASVALFGIIAFVFYTSQRSKKMIFWAGFFTILAIFSKITGLAVLIFFIFDLIKNRKYHELKIFAIGATISLVFVLLITDLLFGFNSLKYVFSQTGSNISSNLEPRSIGKSYFNVLRPEILLPAYVALLFFAKGLKDDLVKKLGTLSLFFIGFFAALVIFSSHVKIYAHYLYSAQIFVTIALGFYLGGFKVKNKKNWLYPDSIFVLVVLGLVVAGLWLGLRYHYDMAGGYLSSIPLWFKSLYVVFTVMMTGLLLLMKSPKSSRWILTFLLVWAMLGSFFVNSSAYSIIASQKQDIAYFYTYALAFRETGLNFSVYEPAQSPDYNKRIVWIYFLFYNQADDSLLRAQRSKMTETINFIKKEDIPNQKGFLITKDLLTVLSLKPEAKIIKTYRAGQGQISILEL